MLSGKESCASSESQAASGYRVYRSVNGAQKSVTIILADFKTGLKKTGILSARHVLFSSPALTDPEKWVLRSGIPENSIKVTKKSLFETDSHNLKAILTSTDDGREIDFGWIKERLLGSEKFTENEVKQAQALVLDVGYFVLNTLSVFRGALLLFFTDQESLQTYVKLWKENSILKRIEESCPLVIEPSDISHLRKALKKYHDSLESGGKVVFFLTMNGKANLNLKRHTSAKTQGERTVVMLGVPLKEPTHASIRNRYDSFQFSLEEKEKLIEALRYEKAAAVIQRLGSLSISQANLSGSVILVDKNYKNKELQELNKEWLGNSLRKFTTLGELLNPLKQFFSLSAESTFKFKSNKSGPSFSEQIAERNANYQKELAHHTAYKPPERTFVAMNPLRKALYEKIKKEEEEKKNSLEPKTQDEESKTDEKALKDSKRENTPAEQSHSSTIQSSQNSKEEDVSFEVKTTSKTKLNPAEAAKKPTQPRTEIPISELTSLDNALTFISNVSVLRNSLNSVTLKQLISTLPSSSATPSIMCSICYEEGLKYSISKCGHICCESCWERALSQTLECPVCKSKTRPKTLIKIENS